MRQQWRGLVPDVSVAALVLALGLLESISRGWSWSALTTSVVVALCVGICRSFPGVAVTLFLALCAVHVLVDARVMVVELGFATVTFAAARWGSRHTLVAGLLVVPAVVVAGVLTIATGVYHPIRGVPDSLNLAEVVARFGGDWYVVAGIFVTVVLGVPWLVGLALRFADGARTAQARQVAAEQNEARALAESVQAHQIARLREDQARLARDVHDVVGHSLAVILAQAESAQYLPADDSEARNRTLQTIATSARSSLQDVRHVLSDGSLRPQADHVLEALIEGVRSTNNDLVSQEQGTPRPMPPEFEFVAYRVLQEMLTNALRHGVRDRPVVVQRVWPDGAAAGELRIEVRKRRCGHIRGS